MRKTEGFKKGSMRWALCNEDYSDLTVNQIAELFDCTRNSVTKAMQDIFRLTGKRIRYTKVDKMSNPIGVGAYGDGQMKADGSA